MGTLSKIGKCARPTDPTTRRLSIGGDRPIGAPFRPPSGHSQPNRLQRTTPPDRSIETLRTPQSTSAQTWQTRMATRPVASPPQLGWANWSSHASPSPKGHPDRSPVHPASMSSICRWSRSSFPFTTGSRNSTRSRVERRPTPTPLGYLASHYSQADRPDDSLLVATNVLVLKAASLTLNRNVTTH